MAQRCMTPWTGGLPHAATHEGNRHPESAGRHWGQHHRFTRPGFPETGADRHFNSLAQRLVPPYQVHK